jgi:hypothetical protein
MASGYDLTMQLVAMNLSAYALPFIIIIPYHQTFNWPKSWQVFPTGVLILPNLVHFVEVPPHPLFYSLSPKLSTHLFLDFTRTTCSLIFLSLLDTGPFSDMWGSMQGFLLFPYAAHMGVYLCIFVFPQLIIGSQPEYTLLQCIRRVQPLLSTKQLLHLQQKT